MSLTIEEKINYLQSNFTTLPQLFNHPYYIELFRKRYTLNIPLFAKEVLDTRLTYQQVDICNLHNPYGGRLAVPSGHGIGKTRLIGVLCLHHIFTAYNSITRVHAPKLTQVTSLSFKEISLLLSNLKYNPMVLGDRTLKRNVWYFLADMIQQNIKLIFVKGARKTWYIEPATAPKAEPNALSGQHNWSYLLILEEAIGIEETHMVASLGALTEERNSAIAFSQHTNTVHLFHQFVTTLGKASGGVWSVYKADGEKSPMVTLKAIKNFRETYTEDEYRVRVKGEPPTTNIGMLLSGQDMDMCYSDKVLKIHEEYYYPTQAYSTDIAYKGIRNSSVTVEALITTVKDEFERIKTVVSVTNIKIYNKETALRPTEVSKQVANTLALEINRANEDILEYHACIDATAGGDEASLVLHEKVNEIKSKIPISVFPITWGDKKRLTNKELSIYRNERAKAYIQLRNAIVEGRFSIRLEKYRTRIKREASDIPFKFDRVYSIGSKEDMKNSPDILDCFAMLFLLPITDVAADINTTHNKLNHTLNSNTRKKLQAPKGLDTSVIDIDVDIFN